MISLDHCRMMAAYNAEMNRRLYAAADRLTEAQRREDRGAFFGSIHATLNHLVWGDTTWMSRFAGWDAPKVGIPGSVALHDDWTALKAIRAETDARIEAWAATIDPAWLGGTLSWFSAAMQRDVSRPTWVLVTHFFNHQTHHRGQAHAMVTGFGEKTGDTDLPFILPFD
jgi:uncharacterized damage-inducible protein DinB